MEGINISTFLVRNILRRPVFVLALLLIVVIASGRYPGCSGSYENRYSQADGRRFTVSGIVTAKELTANGRRQMTLFESFSRARVQTETIMENHRKERQKKRIDYNVAYRMPYDTEREDNEEYDGYLDTARYVCIVKPTSFLEEIVSTMKTNIENETNRIVSVILLKSSE